MNLMRHRVKEHFPTVLLTLLSIVQALALELLWEHLKAAAYLFEWSMIALIGWVQVVATLLGLVIIWTLYASNAMRFRWVPTTADSVYPFFIGLVEFMLIESLGPGNGGVWMILMAMVFAVMVWVSHITMRRARYDADNDAFFAHSQPAKLEDFYLHIGVIGLLFVGGIVLLLIGSGGLVALLLTLMALAMLAWQYHLNALFWEASVAEELEVP